jgi:translation initiation factor 3 subunit A
MICTQKLENYDTEGLITIQVAQLEKEKKGLNERLRVVSKRIDHIERAYRKEEHPLLAQDYEQQQKADRETFEASQKARKESSKTAHQEDLATKVRLARMMNDFSARKEVLLAKKGEEFAKRKEAARKKIEEEKEKKRKAVVKAWEEEKHRQEEEERRKREVEEEERRLEEGSVKQFTLSISKTDPLQRGEQRKSNYAEKKRPKKLQKKRQNAR